MNAHRCPTCGRGTYLAGGAHAPTPRTVARRYCPAPTCDWTGDAPAQTTTPVYYGGATVAAPTYTQGSLLEEV